MRPEIYAGRARYYDKIYHWKDYTAEAALLVERLALEGVTDSARVLEAACGTGSFLVEMKDRYQVTGLDREAGMLEVARAKLPNVELIEADMTSFRVDRPFDAVVCLFSSIGYLLDPESLDRALACFHAALRPGGVLVVEPWLTAEVYRTDFTFLHTYEDEDLKLVRMSYSTRRDEIAVLDFEWLAGETGRGLERFRERHELWLCPRDTMAAALERAGFETRFLPEGLGGPKPRGIFLGRR
ncbi:MAG: type 11 methyltransferase [Gemmatimonadota bacterium]|nr:MAG: type 11 methyltransferase [Gemmatimonadota bacterium]